MYKVADGVLVVVLTRYFFVPYIVRYFSTEVIMHRFFFDACDWDLLSADQGYYYDATLTQQVGPFPVGTAFSVIHIDYNTNQAFLRDERGELLAAVKIQMALEVL